MSSRRFHFFSSRMRRPASLLNSSARTDCKWPTFSPSIGIGAAGLPLAILRFRTDSPVLCIGSAISPDFWAGARQYAQMPRGRLQEALSETRSRGSRYAAFDLDRFGMRWPFNRRAFKVCAALPDQADSFCYSVGVLDRHWADFAH